MHHPVRRRLRAGTLVRVLMAAALAFACGAPAARAADGAYTQILCGNPDTGHGVVASGLPDGVTSHFDQWNMAASLSVTTCAAGQPIGGYGGLHLSVGTEWTAGPYAKGWFRYQAPAGIAFKGARLYRYGGMSSAWAWSIVTAESDNYQSAPRSEDCWGNFGCTVKGSPAVPFAAANAISVDGNGSSGFTAIVACHTNNGTCVAGGQSLRIYGGKVSLQDSAPPTISGASHGALAQDATLAGNADVSVAAADAGAGVYRVIVRIDGVDRAEQIAASNAGRCADVNPANEDDHEFSVARPCASATDGIYTFDTSQLPDGNHRLVVQVEDAAGNRATAINRQVAIDNFPPPVALSAPALSGSPRRGNLLVATPASFDDHGAPGELSVTRAWQRCKADGSACADIAGQSGMTYTLGNADVNRVVRVVETASNTEGEVSAPSVPTARVTQEDGSLPTDNDGVDNDADGTVDEPGETSPSTGPPPPGTGSSSLVGARGPNGTDGSNGSNGSPAQGVANSVGAANGDGASPRARLTAEFGAGGATGKVAFGKTIVAKGRLVDESGRPIRNAIIDVAETPALIGAKAASAQPAVTNDDGAFTYRATSAAGTRTVSFSYRHQRSGPIVSQANLALTVKAGVKLSVKLKGIVATYSGKVLAGAMPRGGKLVIVQGRAKGGSWQTFASRRAGKGGAFKGRYRLKVRRPGKQLQFRVRVLSESGWNYGGVTSKAVTRRVR